MQESATTAPDVSGVLLKFRRTALLRPAIQSVLDRHDLTGEVIVLDDSPQLSAEAVISSFGDPRIDDDDIVPPGYHASATAASAERSNVGLP